MAFTDTFKAVPDQILEALSVTQQLILTNAAALASTAKSFTPVEPTIPFADRLPDPAVLTDNAFSFAEKLMASQRDFSQKLLGTYLPPKAATKPPAAAAKSA